VAIQVLNGSSSRNVYLDAVRGIHPDCSGVHRFAFNNDVGIEYETIWDNGGGIYTYPASALTMTVVSTSALDTMGILITGLDASYKVISESVTLAGLTPVTTTKQFLRINDLQLLTGNNVGSISVTNNAVTYGYISATYGVQQSSVYTDPAGHTFYITQIDITSGTIGANKYGFGRAVMSFYNGPTLRFFETTFVTSQLKYEPPVPFKITEKTDFEFQCKSSSATNEFTVYVNGLLVKE